MYVHALVPSEKTGGIAYYMQITAPRIGYHGDLAHAHEMCTWPGLSPPLSKGVGTRLV